MDNNTKIPPITLVDPPPPTERKIGEPPEKPEREKTKGEFAQYVGKFFRKNSGSIHGEETRYKVLEWIPEIDCGYEVEPRRQQGFKVQRVDPPAEFLRSCVAFDAEFSMVQK
jgi:hypothetical protein